jgi:Ca2+-binding EF-hand superfamily protein
MEGASSAVEAPAVEKLINEDGDPTEEYVGIITQIFTRFDRDKDGILSLREFNSMLHASGEEPTDKHTYGGLLMMFEDDDKKARPAGGGVSLKGFIQMSVLSTVEVLRTYQIFVFYFYFVLI